MFVSLKNIMLSLKGLTWMSKNDIMRVINPSYTDECCHFDGVGDCLLMESWYLVGLSKGKKSLKES